MTHAESPAPEITLTNDTWKANPLAGSSEYQRARVNLFIDPAQRHQLDALSVEWNCTLTEALRRVIERGFCGIMHQSTPSK